MVTCHQRRSFYTRRFILIQSFPAWVRWCNTGDGDFISTSWLVTPGTHLILCWGQAVLTSTTVMVHPWPDATFARPRNSSLSSPPSVVSFHLASNGPCDPRVILPMNCWGLRGLHLPALLSRCLKEYKYRQFLYFELLPYIKRNHKEYLETHKHWEKQSTFLHLQTSWGDECSVDTIQQASCESWSPRSSGRRGSALGHRCWGGLACERRKLPGTAVSFCICETRITFTGGLRGSFVVFMEGVGHGNIVCYPKEHIILRFRKKFTGFIVMS